MVATWDMLFTIREFGLNYIGGWHAVMETEIFRLALDRKTDKQYTRSLVMFTARGLARETWDGFLGDRFGYRGPFTGFPEKEEYYRRGRDGEVLVLSITEPDFKRMLLTNVRRRNFVACMLADVVYIPFAEKGNKTYQLCKQVVASGVPIFTCDCDVNHDLFDLGIPKFNRKNVGRHLESLGASKEAAPPFPPREERAAESARHQSLVLSRPEPRRVGGKQRELFPRK